MMLVLQYTVVGGMPACVQRFLETRDIYAVYALQKDLLSAYQDDMVKYAEPRDKARIRERFESIPVQLAKDNKKIPVFRCTSRRLLVGIRRIPSMD